MVSPSSQSLSRLSKIGWIGLGAMGRPMALNLFTKTHLAHQRGEWAGYGKEKPSFLICEEDDSRAESFLFDLREKGGAGLVNRVERVGSGKEMAMHASRILTMLPSTPQVEAVYLDPKGGILAGLQALPLDTPSLGDLPASTSPVKPVSGVEELSSSTNMSAPYMPPTSSPPLDSPTSFAPASSDPNPSSGADAPHTLLIDQTTLDPTTARDIASQIHATTSHRALMLDAPVSGGTGAAERGELTIMFGSPSSEATRMAVELLGRMARDGGVIDCGSNGAGVGVKVCNNLILAINQIALSEGLALGRSLGLDPVLLHNVVNTSSGQSWSSRVNSPLEEIPGSPGSRHYAGGFQTRLMLKDAGLALSAAAVCNLPIPMTWAAKSVYEAVCNEGEGEMATRDFSVVFEWLKKKQAEGVERGWKADPTST
ncbi:hypothetical protein CI109_102503 [Kwoniella shandongensis]|uniref:3-hydroxyisobutyrate dehydrogenase n=1 Tax=Kwoniella shandongensis TaxID=1734106 RepID=A0A5M6C0R1_9TREE|nr:uncharacterized protein CI109_003179 [Kwoniella shandongensis]KAA5528281.1 hypothetical protein CI109_003179 [Kwoniella shandongensis]